MGAWVQPPVGELKSCMLQGKVKKKILYLHHKKSNHCTLSGGRPWEHIQFGRAKSAKLIEKGDPKTQNKSYDQPRQCVKKQRCYFAHKGPSSQSYGFSCSHVWMWELDCKESWSPKNWCFWTGVLEKTLFFFFYFILFFKLYIILVLPNGEDSWEFLGLQVDPTSPS